MAADVWLVREDNGSSIWPEQPIIDCLPPDVPFLFVSLMIAPADGRNYRLAKSHRLRRHYFSMDFVSVTTFTYIETLASLNSGHPLPEAYP